MNFLIDECLLHTSLVDAPGLVNEAIEVGVVDGEIEITRYALSHEA